MPTHTVHARHAAANERSFVTKYHQPGAENAPAEIFGEGAVNYLDKVRKQSARELEALNAEQKRAGAERNIEAARFYRDLIAAETKTLRAARLWLGWITGGGYSGDAPWVEMYHWPTDFADVLDDVWRGLSLRFA